MFRTVITFFRRCLQVLWCVWCMRACDRSHLYSCIHQWKICNSYTQQSGGALTQTQSYDTVLNEQRETRLDFTSENENDWRARVCYGERSFCLSKYFWNLCICMTFANQISSVHKTDAIFFRRYGAKLCNFSTRMIDKRTNTIPFINLSTQIQLFTKRN